MEKAKIGVPIRIALELHSVSEMGCMCLRHIRKDTGATNGELYGDRVVEAGFRGDRKNNYKLFYSGELLVLPAKAVTGKVLLLFSLIDLVIHPSSWYYFGH